MTTWPRVHSSPCWLSGSVVAGGRIDDLHLDAGQRPADRFDAQLERVVGAGLRDDGRGFGLAVGDRHFAAAPSLSITCRMTSIGQGLPAMMPVRSDVEVAAGERRVLQAGR